VLGTTASTLPLHSEGTEILDHLGCDDGVIVAGFLHDTLEDTSLSPEEIADACTPAVLALVEGAGESDKTLQWKERKQHTIVALRDAEPDVLALVAADKLDNARAIRTRSATSARRRPGRSFARVGPSSTGTTGRSRTPCSRGHPESRLFRTLDYETQELFPDDRQATRLFAGKPLGTPHDARAHLADPIKHWRPGHSAMVIAVEGKAREPFGPVVSEWNKTKGKQDRLDNLCEELGLAASDVGDLRYQLLHRTDSPLIEADRHGASEALMLVHSFDPGDASLGDYQRFARAMGLGDEPTNAVTRESIRGRITLRLGWVGER
jgi:Domain of unknown function (DUF6946)/HD domain